MRLARVTPLASIGLVLLCAAGCYRPYVSPYGSPYGAPGPPVQTLTPGGTYAPGGTYQPTFPQGSSSSSPTPADQYQPPNSTFDQSGSNSNAPFYKPSSSSPPPYSGGGGGVPTYPDAGEEAQFQQGNAKPIAEEDFQLQEQGALEGAGASTSNVAKVTVDNAQFLEPIRSVPQVRDPRTFSTVEVVTEPGSQSPYAHDAEGFRWLRGMAHLDESTGTWSLIYSTLDPHEDRFQGRLTLADDPKLAHLESDAAYLVSGQLDESQTDAAGKPAYRVQSITAWEPSDTF